MKLQIEKNNRPQVLSRLNRIVFGVVILWLATTVLLLVLYRSSPSHPARPHTADDVALLVAHATARASFI
ncbi:MAG TPA: hypothetical protein VH724_14830 [Candidatus Angelobacter sp.]|jgi:hypothetical protein|nr:hypothetical protein [Candidatus Angelobacter sp.]